MDSRIWFYFVSQVTVAFHGRNDSHDLFLSHCLVGAMFRENHPNMRWEDEELEQISVAVKPIVKVGS